MSPAPARRSATCADVFAAPANGVAERIDGSLVIPPRHGLASSSLGAQRPRPFRLAGLNEAVASTDGLRPPLATVSGADDVSVAPFEAVCFPFAVLWPLDPPVAGSDLEA